MKICEICGSKESEELSNREEFEQVTFHVCETCREERNWQSFQSWSY